MPWEPNQTSEIELSVELFPDLESLTISVKRYILGAWVGPEYSSVSIVISFWCK